MIEHAYLIPLIPFAASLIMLFGAKEDPHSPAPWIGIGAMAICLGMSLAILSGFTSGSFADPFYEHNWKWFSFAASIGSMPFLYEMLIGVKIDGPAALLLVVVTLVSLMVQIYSIAYMHADTRYRRYFAFVSFFTASMLGLVVSSNLLVGFMCWELMGLASYLLIGFWFEKDGPTEAQKKAFMTTKLGDSGLYLALLFLFAKVGSFQLTQIQQFYNAGYMPATAAAVIAIGILFGAMGKSAQFPLFIWLPDAMEGPTPGSALIHAATMVAAGIFLVARTFFVFQAAPDVMAAAAWIGCATAFLAAAMALVTYDIKRVLAFSTVSQLGFMMCALGVGGYTSGLFHLTTHAFFKALLFLGAGSVIHSVHTNDLRLMGGLSRKMPITFVTMLCAIAAIAGIPLTSGYYSKDMILANIYHVHRPMFWIMLGTALMTAFYMTRLFVLTFLGDDRDHEKHHHAHESTFMMTGPLVLLAFLALTSGMLLSRHDLIYKLLPVPVVAMGTAAPAPEHVAPSAEKQTVAPSENETHPEGHLPHWLHLTLPFLVFSAISFAFFLYKGPSFAVAESLKTTFAPAFTVLDRRWYLDDAFNLLVVFCDKVAALAYWIDANVVDRVFVDGWGLLTRILAEISNLLDALFVDRTVDGFGGLSVDVGVGLRGLVKEGQVQEYLMYAAIAFSLAATLILTR
ncbi:MAG: NADH-quinone oxidoreductase subunit L [Elusimicrobiota bacterium]|nr:NADH-quinone oxidoreductase subunit L [Elusimicrobiota bacterium]